MGKLAFLSVAFALVAVSFYACDESASESLFEVEDGISLANKAGGVVESTTGVPMIDLGPAAGGWCPDLNARGMVAWNWYTWYKAELAELTELPHDFLALGINNHGQIVGSSWWGAHGPPEAAVVEKGEIAFIARSAGLGSVARDINSRGQVVVTVKGTEAFIWDRGRITVIAPLGESCTIDPHAINDRGEVAGNSWCSAQGHAFHWYKGETTDLGPGSAHDINNRGEIVGRTSEGATVWRNGQLELLGSLGTHGESWAEGINNKGQIVGASWASHTSSLPHISAFLWENGEMRDLGTLGGRAYACAISDNGTVVGYYMQVPGVYSPRAAMWLP